MVYCARNYSQYGITANNLAPGVIATDRNRRSVGRLRRQRTNPCRIPSGRFGTPRRLRGLALLLCSNAGAYITGEDIAVDGGDAPIAVSYMPGDMNPERRFYKWELVILFGLPYFLNQGDRQIFNAVLPVAESRSPCQRRATRCQVATAFTFIYGVLVLFPDFLADLVSRKSSFFEPDDIQPAEPL